MDHNAKTSEVTHVNLTGQCLKGQDHFPATSGLNGQSLHSGLKLRGSDSDILSTNGSERASVMERGLKPQTGCTQACGSSESHV